MDLIAKGVACELGFLGARHVFVILPWGGGGLFLQAAHVRCFLAVCGNFLMDGS